MLRLSDARNFGRTLTGLCLIGGTALLLVGSIVAPQTDHKDKMKELGAIAAHKGPYIAGALLLLAGGILLVPAAVGLIRTFRGPRGVTIGQVAGGLLVFGAAMLIVFYAYTSIEYEMVNHTGLNRPALAEFLHKANNASSQLPVFVLFLATVVLGQILLAVAAWRTRIVPRWVPVLFLVAGILSFGGGKAVNIASNAVAAVAFGMLALTILGMSDAEWGSPVPDTTAPPAAREPAATPA